MLICVGILFLVIALLAFSGISGVYAHRDLAQVVSRRSLELPLSNELQTSVHSLTLYCERLVNQPKDSPLDHRLIEATMSAENKNDDEDGAVPKPAAGFQSRQTKLQEELSWRITYLLNSVKDSLDNYRIQLAKASPTDLSLGKTDNEARIVEEMEKLIGDIERELKLEEENKDYYGWMFEPTATRAFHERVKELKNLANELPGYLTDRMRQCAAQTRGEYRARMGFVFFSTGAAGAS
jgi:hypothetical protein